MYFGPNEAHKDKMASLVRQMFYKNQETGVINLFEGTDGYEMVAKHVISSMSKTW